MSFEAKIKITAHSGASINYAGPLDEAQKDAIVGILNGETDIATLEQEARQMRARMERLECENTQLTGLVESLRAELRQESSLSFRNQVAGLEAQRDMVAEALTKIVRSAELNQAAINTFLLIEAREAIATIQSSGAQEKCGAAC